MLVLGIESTCDETSAALVENGMTIRSHIISSQADDHSRFGGVVPELASRHHVTLILPCIKKALDDARCSLNDIDLIACSQGPGLVGSLLVGIRTAQALAWSLNIPIIGVNHIEAHIYASLMSDPEYEQHLPALGCVLSGGHTSLILIHNIGSYTLLGQTVDDAIGEAFDKAAKMMGLSYPGGPAIEKLAQGGDPTRFPLKAGRVKGSPWGFSLSGLKTAVLYTLQKSTSWTSQDLADLAASFQYTAFSDVLHKVQLAIDEFQLSTVYFGGGVTHNKNVRQRAQNELSTPSFFPKEELCLDNSAMIAGLGFHVWQKEQHTQLMILEPKTRIPFIVDSTQ